MTIQRVNGAADALRSRVKPVEREVMSKEQTLRSEDNAFLPLRRRQLSVRNGVKAIEAASQAPKKL
jgi:hypothetical protein